MRDTVRPWLVAAAALAVAGIAVNVWRPVAPPTRPVVTDLDDFPGSVLVVIDAYRGPRRAATMAVLALSAVVPVAVVVTRRGRRLLERVGGTRRPVVGGAGVAVVAVALTDLASLPVDLSVGYVHERRYGFRTSDVVGWLRDWGVTHGVAWVLAGLAGAVFVIALGRWPRSWPWRAVVVGTGVSAVLVLAGPLVLEPLLLETRELEDGGTRRAVEEVLARAGEPGVPIVVGDASRRTTKVNAYVSGLGPSRRVVLFDNLLELSPDQVAAVVAHELAHRQHRDIPRGVLLTAAALVPVALVTRAAVESRWVATQFTPRPGGDPRLVAVGVAVVAVASLVGLPVASALSRRAEAAADHRALVLTADPSPLIAIDRAFVLRDLADPTPPRWLHLLVGTHPTPSERIRAAVDQAQRQGYAVPTLAELSEDEPHHDRLRQE